MKFLSKGERIELLIQYLSDGEFHSGEVLGKGIGISRAAIWKYMKLLAELGLEIDSVRGKGYRIEGGLNLLDEQVISNQLHKESKKLIRKIEVFKHIGSTNQYLLDKVELGEDVHGFVCLAEQQSAGRGRRGREWVSPFAQNIYCSLQWRFDKGIQALEGLSLVVALAIVEAMEAQGVRGLSLKWPNDILGDGRKLAGILLEVRGDLSDYCDVVIGFGINVSMSAKSGELIDQAWVDASSLSKQVLNRNSIIPLVLDQLLAHLMRFEVEGFKSFQQRWNSLDGFMGKQVSIIAGKDTQFGIEKGVNSQGVLLVESDGVLKTFHGGELSLRAVNETLA